MKDNCKYIMKISKYEKRDYGSTEIENLMKYFKEEVKISKIMGINAIGPRVYESAIMSVSNYDKIILLMVLEKYEIDLHDFVSNYEINKQQAKYIIKQLKDKVNRMHQLGYVHCDIKPANIILNNITSDTPDVALIDFGTSFYRTGTSDFSETIFYYYVKNGILPFVKIYEKNKAKGIKDSEYIGDDYKTNVRSDLYAVEGVELFIQKLAL